MLEWTIILNIVQTIVAAMIIWYWQRRQTKKEAIVARRAEIRKEESLLSLEMNMANAKLTYAVAKAYKKGELNGELDEGINAYKEAKDKYLKFLNEQASESLNRKH
jgi:biopolymer transport protein ExbB/TolQ